MRVESLSTELRAAVQRLQQARAALSRRVIPAAPVSSCASTGPSPLLAFRRSLER